MPSKSLLRILFGFSLLSCLSLAPHAQNSVPEKDFEWLEKFYFLYETVRPGHWENSPQIKFDPTGIVTVNGTNYNPVTISQYALICFDYYRETGDERFKKAFNAQVKWLLNDSVYVEQGDMIYYPYRFSFHDLQPGWMSGLAQGEVIAVLIRSYYLDRNPKTLEFIRKVCNHMLAEVKDGGCLLKTPEGGWWIEEYVKSRQHLHVLNGNMVSIFCLYEYTKLFPDDKRANELYPQLLESLKKSVDVYDCGYGLRYDRGTGAVVVPWYMKAQVIEMKTLHHITKDIFYHRKMMHWMTYCYNKHVGMVDCIVDDLNFSTPTTSDKNNDIIMACETTGMLKTGNCTVSIFPDSRKFPATNIVDNTGNTFSDFAITDSVKENPHAEVWLLRGGTANQLKVSYRPGSKVPEVKHFIGIDEKTVRKTMKVKKLNGPEPSTNYYEFPSMKLTGFRVVFEMPDAAGFQLTDINISNTAEATCSEYVNYTSKVTPCNDVNLKLDAKPEGAKEVAVYIRTGISTADIAARAWSFVNDEFPANSKLNKGFFQVMIVAKPENPAEFKIKKLVSEPVLAQ